jgi:hypothetical protein
VALRGDCLWREGEGDDAALAGEEDVLLSVSFEMGGLAQVATRRDKMLLQRTRCPSRLYTWWNLGDGIASTEHD